MNLRGCCGCLFLVICVIAAIIAVGIARGPRITARAKSWLSEKFEEAARQSEFERAWEPPSAAPDASWFPAHVGEWQRESSTPTDGLPELALTTAGWHADYRHNGRKVQINVVPANELEKEAIFARAKEALKTGGTFRMVQTGSELSVRISGGQQTRLWWLKGWLFIFRTADTDSRHFAEEYLAAMQKQELEKR